jgi:hypothetical protein
MTLSAINPGAVLQRVYYCVPAAYHQGDSFPSYVDAALCALTRWAEVDCEFVIAPPVVDERWVLEDGGATVDVIFCRGTVALDIVHGVVGNAARRAAADRAAAVIRKAMPTGATSAG